MCVSPQCALYVLEKENYKNTEYIMYYYIEPPCVCVGRLKSKKNDILYFKFVSLSLWVLGIQKFFFNKTFLKVFYYLECAQPFFVFFIWLNDLAPLTRE